MKKNYDWVLFDADDTLFHFDAFRGLQQMFSEFNVVFTENDFLEYQALNKTLWIDYQNNAITAKQVQLQRFTAWGHKLNVSPQQLNSAFLSAMAEICVPLEGAVSLLNTLKGKSKLGIITNGFTELQQIRLERTGLSDHFEILVVSEEVGVAKPHIDIFEHALTRMGYPPRERVLMVGDNPDSDILGGVNAGFDTCWFNANNKPTPQHVTPTYQITSLRELELLFVK